MTQVNPYAILNTPSAAAGNATAQAAAASGAAAGVAAATQQLGSQQFLQLMVTQLKNQNPLQPLDPTQFVGQLAQFSEVSGVQEMNRSLSGLSSLMSSSQMLSGAALVGHQVLAPGASVAFDGSNAVQGAIDVPAGVTSVNVQVRDASGQLVRTIALAPQTGLSGFTWDGQTDKGAAAPSGQYSLAAIASVGGTNQSLATLVADRVNSVSLDPATNALTLNTGALGPLALSTVRQIF
jgi:flagellar basal-body rod modification protein FlgD